MNENDQIIAQRLQMQFNEEERHRKSIEQNDAILAKKIVAAEHQLSDSDNEEEIVELINTAEGQGETDGKKYLNLSSTKLPPCKYGLNCYRKNSQHFQEFNHQNLASTSAVNKKDTSEPPRKKVKVMDYSRKKKPVNNVSGKKSSLRQMPFTERLDASAPYNLFLNKVFSVSATHKDPLTLVFPDLLNSKMGTLIESLQLNFMVDLEFVKSFYKVCGVEDKPLLVMYGQIGGNSKTFPKAVLVPVNMPFQFGVHHSKIMVFQYKEGLRIVIHTANLVPDDWYEKTQGYWISPMFPPLSNGKSSLLDGESPTCFKKDFVDYMLSYKSPDMTRWSHIVKSYDFSSCRAIFIGSVPGYHKGEKMFQFGHPKVCKFLKKYSNWQAGSSAPVIAQCSSIGSQGNNAKSWLTGELGVSLSGGNEISKSTVNVIYPSEEDVKNSSQGYGGGSCLPYNSATHAKQEWLMYHFYRWSSNCRKRTESMPHIKSYVRMKGDKLQYFILTSANLSKAAWGQFQKTRSQLFIRSYEAGVLLLPKYIIEKDSFDFADGGLSLHYDLPLIPYEQGSRPWFINTEKISPDIMGQYYP